MKRKREIDNLANSRLNFEDDPIIELKPLESAKKYLSFLLQYDRDNVDTSISNTSLSTTAETITNVTFRFADSKDHKNDNGATQYATCMFQKYWNIVESKYDDQSAVRTVINRILDTKLNNPSDPANTISQAIYQARLSLLDEKSNDEGTKELSQFILNNKGNINLNDLSIAFKLLQSMTSNLENY